MAAIDHASGHWRAGYRPTALEKFLHILAFSRRHADRQTSSRSKVDFTTATRKQYVKLHWKKPIAGCVKTDIPRSIRMSKSYNSLLSIVKKNSDRPTMARNRLKAEKLASGAGENQENKAELTPLSSAAISKQSFIRLRRKVDFNELRAKHALIDCFQIDRGKLLVRQPERRVSFELESSLPEKENELSAVQKCQQQLDLIGVADWQLSTGKYLHCEL
ncbi:hypothetical protein T11_18470 [Trichinella zimbabwensis]|uniref:Uncharacterized protein n=1 Tax=Trichinella zimbabwensis TaxID=268475 RepID=A0A0V1H9F4_9BILA|nr:hypothetical protein T11_18470 [Trichinella zimbabwensis]